MKRAAVLKVFRTDDSHLWRIVRVGTEYYLYHYNTYEGPNEGPNKGWALVQQCGSVDEAERWARGTFYSKE